MVDLKISCPLGLGDIIMIHNILENEKHRFNRIHINPRWDIINACKNGSVEYKNFFTTLMSMLFTDSKYVLDDGEAYEYTGPFILANTYNVTRPKLKEIFNYGKSCLDYEYIVVCTKVRALGFNEWAAVKTEFINILRRASKICKIVIVGEREIEMNSEYVALPDALKPYSIYNDLLGLLPDVEFVDMTVPKLGIIVPDIENIKRDCSVMSGSKATFVFGIGGIFWLAAGASSRMIALCSKCGATNNDYIILNKMFSGDIGFDILPSGYLFLQRANKFIEEGLCITDKMD
jgi:hypothetical protein